MKLKLEDAIDWLQRLKKPLPNDTEINVSSFSVEELPSGKRIVKANIATEIYYPNGINKPTADTERT